MTHPDNGGIWGSEAPLPWVQQDYDVYMPTFPDTGEPVKAHELDAWLQMITDDDTLTEAHRKVAEYIVQQVRAQSS